MSKNKNKTRQINSLNQMKIVNLSLIDGDFVILDNLNIEIIPGKFNVIFGENGAGKTSLLECLVNIRRDYSGDVNFSEDVSFFEAHPNFDGKLKVKDFLELSFIASKFKTMNMKAEVSEILKQYKIMHISNSKLKSLSSGQKRLVYLISKQKEIADILIFDEPTANLDPAMRDFIFSEINELNKNGKTVIVCTHLTNEISKYIDVVTIISKGKVFYSGAYKKRIVDDFFTNKRVLSDVKRGS